MQLALNDVDSPECSSPQQRRLQARLRSRLWDCLKADDADRLARVLNEVAPSASEHHRLMYNLRSWMWSEHNQAEGHGAPNTGLLSCAAANRFGVPTGTGAHRCVAELVQHAEPYELAEARARYWHKVEQGQIPRRPAVEGWLALA